MNAFFTGIHQTVLPGRHEDQGPLPPLLLGMTVVTGLVDAFSYLTLGHVFVANMTGNVVFLAFALMGSNGFSIAGSLLALASFAVGAAAGGRFAARLADTRARLLGACAGVQTVLLVGAAALTAASATRVPTASRDVLIVLLGAAMGLQNAAARKLAVPDLTTTVLTLTITGIAADPLSITHNAAAAGRRVVSVVCMFAGALLGAALIVGHQGHYPLVAAAVIIAVVGATVWRLGASDPPWSRLTR
ncbi:MAG: YoaK family protein [Acidimicrobiales bacterium]|jgi:uncharacterized membrane protein YoaK (UPF0700 family)